MRRLGFIGLVFLTACLSGATSPTSITNIQIQSNTSPNGVFAGDVIQLNVEAQDAAGDVVPVAFTYASSNHAVATIDANGLITAVGAGTSTITVSTVGRSTTLTLTVDGNISNGVQITPPSATIAPGQSIQLTAAVITTLGNPARGKSVSWSTSDGTKVSVDNAGNIHGIASSPGVTVCATPTDATSVKGCATVVVQPPASSSSAR
jgi:uncharacterized protein YjdB